MREHTGLYRGKRVDNGEWVEGNLLTLHDGRCFTVNNIFGACIDADGNFINTEAPFVCEVDPETVGECTGLRDKNGKLIFEGDVCLCDRNINDRLDRKVYEIKCEPTRGFFGENFCEISADEFYMAEIIGTIHDNTELLKGGGE